MNKAIALKLKAKAEEIAATFSQEREFNYTKEVFELEDIKPLSETTACAIYKKNSGKKAVAFMYYLVSQDGHWRYFFPSESHSVGMGRFIEELKEIDNFNFDLNFQAIATA